MPPITAAQHFFSSVPADQSPTKRRGYQTLFRTRSLTDDAVHAIEDRAQYVTAPGDPIKRQFYALSGGSFAVSQSVALAEPDEFGRKGRYLSHTLIFDRNAFQQISICPLDVLTQFKFAVSLAEAFAQGQSTTAEVPNIRVEITPQWLTRAAQMAVSWPSDQLTKLGQLAWQAKALNEKREAVAFIGSESEILDTLAITFLLTAPIDWGWLSFDTYSAGCDWGRSVKFWGQGYTDRAEAKAAHAIDINTRRINTSLSLAADRPYTTWMIKEVLPTHARFDALEQQRVWARQLEATLLDGIPARGVPPDFIGQFARVNAPAVTSSLLAYLPQGLSPEFVRPLAREVTNDASDYLNALVDGERAEHIPVFLYNALLQLKAIPAKPDRSVLEKWIKATPHAGLQTLPPFWNKDEGAWRDRLKALPAEDYEGLMKDLVDWPQPSIALREALVEPYALTWIRVVGPKLPPSDWKKVLPILEKIGDSSVEAIVEIVPWLVEPTRTEIAKWLKGYKGAALNLRAALGVPLEAKKGSRFLR